MLIDIIPWFSWNPYGRAYLSSSSGLTWSLSKSVCLLLLMSAGSSDLADLFLFFLISLPWAIFRFLSVYGKVIDFHMSIVNSETSSVNCGGLSVAIWLFPWTLVSCENGTFLSRPAGVASGCGGRATGCASFRVQWGDLHAASWARLSVTGSVDAFWLQEVLGHC